MPISKKTPLERYRDLQASGALAPDPAQQRLVEALDALHARITGEGFFHEKLMSAGGWIPRLFHRNRPAGSSGMYIWGDVGRGKSMLMDIFFQSLPEERKLRIHFHAFMTLIHGEIHKLRKAAADGQGEGGKDPLLIVTGNIAEQYHVICFDEFQVNDIADAMILSRLFTVLFNKGTIVIFTSNRPPESLYLGGLQRERFLPFIDLLVGRVEVLQLAAHQDYRAGRVQAMQTVYFTPLGPQSQRFLDETFMALACDGAAFEHRIEVQGRTLVIPHACRDIAYFTFDELCNKPMAALDYLALAQLYRTFLVADIPIMGPDMRNAAKRFVTLIDVLYEAHATLICSAETAPENLYPKGDGSFEFHRTVSRLMEMQSQDYLAASQKPRIAVS